MAINQHFSHGTELRNQQPGYNAYIWPYVEKYPIICYSIEYNNAVM